MEEDALRRQIDETLLPFLLEADEAESQRLLARLISVHADPILKGAIRRKLCASLDSTASHDAEDIRSEALVQLIARLRTLKSAPEENVIQDFRSYVATTASRVFYAFLRQKYPRRHSLKNRMRHLLTHQQRFALWESDQHEWLCGFADWRDRKEAERWGRLRQLGDDPHAIGEGDLSTGDFQRGDLAGLLDALFKRLGAPVGLDDLVSFVADRWQIRDLPARTGTVRDGKSNPLESLPSPEPDVADQVGRRIYLQRLWAEIRELQPRQRAALLLNLKDAAGRGVIALFPATGVASIRQIAETLDDLGRGV